MKIHTIFYKHSKKVQYSFAISLGIAIISLLLSLFFSIQDPFRIYCDSVQETILSQSELLENKEFITGLASKDIEKITLGEIEKYRESGIIYQVYNKESKLKFWTDKSFSFNQFLLDKFNEKQKLYYFDEIPFVVTSKIVNGNKIVSIVNVNKLIDDKIEDEIKLIIRDEKSINYKVTSFPSQDDIHVKTKGNEFLFSIVKNSYYNDIQIVIGLILIVLSFLFFLKGLNHYCEELSVKNSFYASLIFGGVLYLIRKVMVTFQIPSKFYQLKLFNPSLYSSDVTPSLGDLLIFLLFTQFTIVFIRRNWDINLTPISKKFKIGFLLHTLLLILLLGEAFSISKIFERLVLESSIYFYFNYFPRLTIYSFIGLAIMLISFINYYLLSNIILKALSKIQLSNNQRIVSFCIFIISSIVLIFAYDLKQEVKVLLFLLPMFVIVFYLRYFTKRDNKTLSISIFLFFASTLTTYLLHSYNDKKEMQIESYIADFVGFGRDKSASLAVKNRILFAKNKSSDKYNLTILDKYQYRNYINEWDANQSKIEDNDNFSLYFLENSLEKFYVSEYNHSYFKVEPGYVKNRRMKQIVNEEMDRMNYSLYINDSLLSYKGRIPQKTIIKGDNKDGNIYNISESVKVLISKNESITLSILVKFSFIFCFNILLLLAFQILSMVISNDRKYIIKFDSLRLKIMSFMMIFVAMIFLSIGIVSYQNMTRTIDNELKSEIINNISISKKATALITDNTQYLKDFYNKMIALYNYDIKIFKNNAEIISKYSKLNDNNDYRELIAPEVYWKLRNGYSLIQKEDNGRDWYNFNDNISSNIISISPNQREKRLNDTNRFFVSLTNLYVFMFFVTLLLFYWLSSYITNPINKLSESLKRLNISKKNEYITYNQKDEIGKLVRRYNKMVDEIEESTKKLAEQERGMAWNEMARQVAHEIKNPLTPMKLKIQSLQHKISSGTPNIEEDVSKLSKILVEQIDQLEYIADTFRTFSNIGEYKYEKIDWVSMIENCIELYDTDDIDFEFVKEKEEAWVVFEHNQMISCLNNVVKNAIQSYDDEKGKVKLTLEDDQDNFTLKVKDWGRGISIGNVKKIFQPNFTTKNSGTGLGLAITKKIVMTYNGDISFKTIENEGTEFIIKIPKIKD